MITHGELFAGIGGFGLGFDRAGMKTVWHVEIDTRCQEILRRHNPDGLILSDVCECGKKNLPQVDIISFGSPCQDLSVAGKRKGFQDGTRSNLFFEAIRIVDELKPAVAVWENVPGALSSHSGRDFAAVLSAFQECGARDIAWRILDARYFGVAQRRRRVFVVADFRGERAGEILFESESGAGDTPPSRKAGKEVAFTPGTNTGSSSNKGDGGINTTLVPDVSKSLTTGTGNRLNPSDTTFAISGIAEYKQQLGTLRANGGDLGGGSEVLVANTLSTSLGHHGWSVGDQDINNLVPVTDDKAVLAFNGRGDGSDSQENITPTMRSLPNKDGHQAGSTGLCVAFQQNTRDEVRLMGGKGQYAGALSAQPGMKQQNYIAWEMSHASEAVRESGDISPTLQQRMGTGGNQVPMVGVRRLTPTECARLQGFPDDWCAGQADTTQYRQYGNAVAVPVVEWIGKRIESAISDTPPKS